MLHCKISRGRFSYLHPDRSKPITGRSLGTQYEENVSAVHYLVEMPTIKIPDTAPEPSSPEHRNSSAPLISRPEGKTELPTFVFIKSDLRLVVDLQQLRESTAKCRLTHRKVKLSNLQQMAKDRRLCTGAWISDSTGRFSRSAFTECTITDCRNEKSLTHLPSRNLKRDK